MDERRKYKRQSPSKYPTVFNHRTGNPIGKLANLSANGAMLITDEPVKPAALLFCRIELKQKILGLKNLKFEAECRWCRKNVRANNWESGYWLNAEGVYKELISYLVLKYGLDKKDAGATGEIATIELESRRRETRFVLDMDLPVYEKDNYRQIGTIADISTQGLRLITQKKTPKNELIGCRVILPQKIFQQEFIMFEARCMWSKSGRNKSGCESGYIIESISPQDAAVILNLIIHHGSPQETKKRIQVLNR